MHEKKYESFGEKNLNEGHFAHRDLKMENILAKTTTNGDGTCQLVCKVSDLGFATAIGSEELTD